jgi:hypothetical protein
MMSWLIQEHRKSCDRLIALFSKEGKQQKNWLPVFSEEVTSRGQKARKLSTNLFLTSQGLRP